jgi:hypothetical protein
MERSTFSEDNSVPFRIRSSLLSNLILTVRAVKAYAAGKSGITSCLPTIRELIGSVNPAALQGIDVRSMMSPEPWSGQSAVM